MNSEQFQQQFAAALNGQTAVFSETNISGPASVAQLLQLYQNNYIISLSEYLQAVFPVCYALVGDEFFAQLAKAYIQNTPPVRPQVNGYGSEFAGFIDRCPHTEQLPYLADVARLEYQLDSLGNRRYQAVTAFPIDRFSQLTEEEQRRVQLKHNPNLRTFSSPHPVLTIYEGVKSQDFSQIDLSQSQNIALLLQQDQGVRCHPLDSQALALFSALPGNDISSLADIYGDRVSKLLPQWIQQGFIVDFDLKHDH